MCGHVGVAGKLGVDEENAFRTLLILDSLRGEHSTGVAAVHGDLSTTVAKSVGDPFELFRNVRFEQIMKKNNTVLIGHNRYATQGKVNVRNAHPFVIEEELIGAHNGTLTNKYALHQGHQFEVDSEALYDHIYHKGLKSALATALGAWCLVWFDKRDNTLNFLRNKERPLWMATCTKDNVLFWASEKWMLEVAITRNKLQIKELFELQIDSHVAIEVAVGNNIGKPVVTPAAGTAVSAWPQGKHQGKWTGVHTAAGTNSPQQQKQHSAPASNVASTSAADGSQLNRKNVTFFGMVVDTDASGGQFLDCFDQDNTSDSYRLYSNSMNDIEQMVGEYFTGDISSVAYFQGEKYYKIRASSVKLDDTVILRDAKGQQVTEEEWRKKYTCCAMCTGRVSPFANNRYTTQGDVICPVCAEDPQIHSYVHLV